MPSEPLTTEPAIVELWREAFGEPPTILLAPELMLQVLALYRDGGVREAAS